MKKQREKSKCATCGEEFEHKYIYRKSKYCSRLCWSKRNPQISLECVYCGKEFWVWKSHLGGGGRRQLYCCRKCYALDQRKRQAGCKSHLWKGGATKESQKERTRAQYRAWRLAVFERDNFTCQNCNKKSGQGKRIYLHAHHLEHFSESARKRFEVDNGITLCKDCHILKHPHLIKREISAKRLSQEVLPL